MRPVSRRGALSALVAAPALAATPAFSAMAVAPTWAAGFEGQRKADLGDGTFLNPIMAGDHPDPTILRDGADYYMTFSSFDAYPGLVVRAGPIGVQLTRSRERQITRPG